MPDKDPIQRAAESHLAILERDAGDALMDAEADTFPGGWDAWMTATAADDPAVDAHAERTFAAVLRRLAPMLEEAARAADERAAKIDAGEVV